MQKHVGHVVDEDDFELEVWVELLPDGAYEHVYVLYGGSQLGDFPFGHPSQNNELEEAAQMVAADPKHKTVTLPLLIMED